MNAPATELSAVAQRALQTPIDDIDVSDPDLFFDDTVELYFDRLRREAPVHLGHSPLFGDYWSITTYKDIMHVDTNHGIFSSDMSNGGITIADPPMEFRTPSFITMDPPKHDDQRKAVSPIVAPANLAQMEHTIRERTQEVLRKLPRNQPFNWVDDVSIELTTRMLATLFDYPFEERRMLTHWSDVASAIPGTSGVATTWDERAQVLGECLASFPNSGTNASMRRPRRT